MSTRFCPFALRAFESFADGSSAAAASFTSCCCAPTGAAIKPTTTTVDQILIQPSQLLSRSHHLDPERPVVEALAVGVVAGRAFLLQLLRRHLDLVPLAGRHDA